MRLAFLTSPGFDWATGDYGGLRNEVDAIVNGLAHQGIQTEILNWTGDAAPLANRDAVCMQTYFGYQEHLPEFLTMLDQLDQAGIRCLNDTDVLRWNLHKGYLQTLQASGVRILPTLFMQSGQKAEMLAAIRAEGWREAVIKPAVSAGAWHTFRFSAEQSDAATLMDGLPEGMDWLIQPFAPEILADGEWSFLFFNGHFSHAVRKTAKPGDFRIQHVHGGSYQHLIAEASALAQAAEALKAVPFDTVYARVDGILRDGLLYLMEIELMEPFLYMLPDPQAVDHCVKALAERVSQARPQAA